MDKTVLDKFMNEMLTLLQTAKDFAVTQVPEVCKEVLRFNLLQAIFLVLLSFCVFGVALAFGKYVNKRAKETGDDDYHLFHFVTALISIVGIAMFICNMIDIIKIEAAPPLYLIEYFSQLIGHK